LGFGVLEPPLQVLLGLALALAVHEPLHLVAARMLGLRARLKPFRRGFLVAILCIVEYKGPGKHTAVALAPLAVAIILLALKMWWALPVYLSTMLQDFRAAMWAAKKAVERRLK
jgi:hypothetical protein